jgi:DNA adenine methylase
MKMNELDNVKPILKWVGGKRQLLPELRKYYSNLDFNKYIEPFFGGGSVYLDIIKIHGIQKKEKSIINDINSDLINLLVDVKHDPKKIINNTNKLKSIYDKEGYYFIRNHYNGEDRITKEPVTKYKGINRSSSLILLNKTCFNGLYRINKRGLFNVPKGSMKNPTIIDEDNFLRFSNLLPKTENIRNNEYSSIKEISPKDLVYFDPPYHPLNTTSSFTKYSSEFNEKEQIELFEYFKKLDDKGVYVILSNSSSNFIKELYREYNPQIVYCKRHINSKGNKRGEIPEVLILGKTIQNMLNLNFS